MVTVYHYTIFFISHSKYIYIFQIKNVSIISKNVLFLFGNLNCHLYLIIMWFIPENFELVYDYLVYHNKNMFNFFSLWNIYIFMYWNPVVFLLFKSSTSNSMLSLIACMYNNYISRKKDTKLKFRIFIFYVLLIKSVNMIWSNHFINQLQLRQTHFILNRKSFCQTLF